MAKARLSSVPSGKISYFGGAIAPNGYLLCDGSILLRASYPDLFAAIGVFHGYGNNDGLSFHLPDSRGKFIRCVDGTANIDPDKLTRTAANAGGNTGNNVGSIQLDEHKSHGHAFPWTTATGTTGRIQSGSQTNGATVYPNPNQVQVTGGNETRPVNFSASCIIKI